MRLDFLKQKMLIVSDKLNVSAYPEFPAVYPTLKNSLSKTSVENDLVSFEKKRGPSLPFMYPNYQEWSIGMAGTSLAANSKGAANKAKASALALGENETIDSNRGSYRTREDSPPNNSHNSTSSSATSSNQQHIQSGFCSHSHRFFHGYLWSELF